MYVKHMIDEAVVDPDLILLENISHEDREESGSTFNKGAKSNCGPNIVVGDETLSGEDPFTTTPQTTAATVARTSSTSTPINTTNPSTTNSATTDPASTDLDPDPAIADLNPSIEGEPPVKRGRGRPRKTPTAPSTPLTYPTHSAPPPPTATFLPTTSKRGRPIKTPHAHPAYLEHPTPTTTKRRPRKTPHVHLAYLEHPTPPTSLPTTSKRERGRGNVIQKIINHGMSVFQAENGFKAFNPGMPSLKILYWCNQSDKIS
uniref:Arabinogalactan protein n=1 Tax=Solanum tuberosum TaxID=4113 RepID=M0ZWQ9_SOLTU